MSNHPTELIFLGSGTSTGVPEIGCSCRVCTSVNPKDKRLRASVLIQSENQTILIDSGPDFRQQMLTYQIKNLTAILLTHEHYDHVAGLDDIRPFGEMDIYALERVLHTLEKNMPYAFFDNKMKLNLPKIKLHEIFHDEFMVGSWKIQPILLKHMYLTVLGFKINNVAYLTDFNEIPDGELEKLKNVQFLIIDALRIQTHPSHNSLEQALDFIKKIKPKMAYLTHMSHHMGLHEEVQHKLPENVFLAYDGLRLCL